MAFPVFPDREKGSVILVRFLVWPDPWTWSPYAVSVHVPRRNGRFWGTQQGVREAMRREI
jgi:hypothetical protein